MLTRSRRVYERSWNTCPLVPILFSNYSPPFFALSFSLVFPQTSGHRKDGKGSVYVWCSVYTVYIYIYSTLFPPMDDTSRGRSITTLLRLLLLRENSLAKKEKKNSDMSRTVSIAEDCHVSTTAPLLTRLSSQQPGIYIHPTKSCSRIDYIRPIIHILFFFSPEPKI